MSSALIIAVAVAFLLALDLAFVAWRYALDDRPTPVPVPTSDGWSLTAWFRPALHKRFKTPVVLCHGLANNHAFMEFQGEHSLARFLSAAGFDVFSVDLRGCGRFTPPHEGPWSVTFDDHVERDLPAFVDVITERTGASQVLWVGHSLGGLVALAAASTSLRGRLAGLVTVGSPVFFSFPRALVGLIHLACALAPWGAFNANVLRVIAPFAGRFPAPPFANASANLDNIEPRAQRFLVANVFAPMWKGVLLQLADWIGHDAFRSGDGRVNYRAGIETLELPVLVVGGTVDHLCPPRASEQLHALLRTPQKELLLFGKAHGHDADYGHGDLILGRHAPREIYPALLRFLERVATQP